jgi:hypothetical protein
VPEVLVSRKKGGVWFRELCKPSMGGRVKQVVGEPGSRKLVREED